jgi:hypothetical protein
MVESVGGCRSPGVRTAGQTSQQRHDSIDATHALRILLMNREDLLGGLLDAPIGDTRLAQCEHDT